MRTTNRKQMTAAGLMLAAGILCAVGWAGRPEGGENPQKGYVPLQQEAETAGETEINGTAGQAFTDPGTEKGFAGVTGSETEKGSEEAAGPALDAAQRRILDDLTEYLSEGRFEEAARLILSEEDALSQLYYETMGRRKYLYRSGTLSQELEGSGLVLAKTSLVFLGDFAQGRPNGECMGFQAIELDYPRYDLAEGNWTDGKMNGRGIVSYCYFEGSGEDNLQVAREGMFVDDKMDGDVVLTTVNAEGETSSWSMKAEDGTLLLDDAWVRDEESGVYQLPSDQDKGHAYVVTAETGEIRFQNLLLWE